MSKSFWAIKRDGLNPYKFYIKSCCSFSAEIQQLELENRFTVAVCAGNEAQARAMCKDIADAKAKKMIFVPITVPARRGQGKTTQVDRTWPK